MLACGREYVHELHCCVHVVCTRKHGFKDTGEASKLLHPYL